MPRRQLILFSILLIISIVSLLLNEPTTLALSTRLSHILLFPVRTTTSFLDFLTVSSNRIEDLEIMVNRLKLENAKLRDKVFLDTTGLEETTIDLLKARITGRDPSNINGYLHIDKGKEHNLYINQPVISIHGLIGKIKFVNTYTSIVETIENRGFAVSAIDTKTGIYGVIKQKGVLLFDYVKTSDEINIGDSIFTSGMSEIFPAGILLGTVKEIQQTNDLFFKQVFISPSVQINRLTSVYVISGNITEQSRAEHPETQE